MNYRSFLAALVISCLLVSATDLPATAADESIRVASFPFKPLIFSDDAGAVKGVNADLLMQIGKLNDWQLEFVHGSWNDGLERAKEKRVDLLTSVMYTEKRDSFLDYTKEPFFTVWGEVYALFSSRVENIFDLQNQTIAIMKEDLSGKNFRKLADSFSIDCEYIEAASHNEVFTLVQQGHARAGVAPNIFGLANSGQYGVTRTPIIFSPKPLYFAVPEGRNQELLKTIDQTLQRWKQDQNSFYYQTLNRWLSGETGRQAKWPKWASVVIGCSILIALLVLLWNKTLHAQVKQQTKRLSESERRFRTLFNEATIGLGMADAKTGIMLAINAELAKMVERTPEEMVGQPQSLIHPEAVEKDGITNHFRHHRDEASGEVVEAMLVTKNGREFPCEIQATIIELEGREVMFGSFRDISKRKDAEEKKQELEIQLRQKFKMEALGVMAGGMAHNFNNNMTIILGNIDLVMLQNSENSELVRQLQNAKIALMRSRDLVRQIMGYSRQEETEMKPAQIAQLLDETLNLLKSTLPSSIELHKQISPQAAETTIIADETRLQEALINLCTNASHAMDEKGVLGIDLKIVDLLRDEIPAQFSCSPGRYLQLSISDTGCGIPAENAEKIFDPFFTTKDVDKGSGMGLATVRGTIEQHHGLIKLESRIGEGSTFKLYFPAVAAAQKVENRNQVEIIEGSERILLVDDDEMLATVSETMLRQLGYQVTAFSNAVEALNHFRQDPAAFDLLLTDKTMPELSGIELAQEVKRIRPSLPVILCTGYSSKESEESNIDAIIDAFCNKPLEMAELSQIVRTTLDSAKESR
ncbi:PAS domain S-box-containing protein [Malonomonas rubra DSM 5091]|uniref:histidine kinase n=1 Tax=Malonomonas rubra DSM 5091 TaxID=1122189 RepID=A0A1M6GHI6_MALRU|nr:response regulator [Malonomonas rubra]SHJ09353.1 PAS domain S-box-containing protein [Malonomonas rubra DSM 5091]